jgi:myo-inositol 2-dehydrogenase/D-chiro-inositol 1-dehydrogenase
VTSLKVGLIGAGGISRVHAEGWKAIGAQTTVYSVAGAEALAKQYDFAVADDLDALFGASDIVDIVAPTSAHHPLAIAAIAAGKHVICEKPLGMNTEQARDIVRAAGEAGVQLYPAHVVRFFPAYVRIKELVDAGGVGTPAVLRFTRGGEAPRPGSWFFSRSAGGGIILDQMIHDLDQALWLAGDVTQVYAVQNPHADGDDVPAPVTAQVVLTHASGAISHVQGLWGPPGLTFRTSIDVAGDGGMIAHDSRTDEAVTVDLPGLTSAGGYLPPATKAESPYTTQLRAFVAAIEAGEPARVTGADGIRAVALAEAAAESIDTGRAVDVDLAAATAGLENERSAA